MPTRTLSSGRCSTASCSFSAATALTIARPARTACSASFSWAWGYPTMADQTVSQVLCDVAVAAEDGIHNRMLESRDDIAPFFGVEAGGDPSRIDQVGHQDRQVTPFAVYERLRRIAARAHIAGPLGRRRIRRLQRRRTFPAKFGVQEVVGSALRTAPDEPRRTLDAEPGVAGILSATCQAFHHAAHPSSGLPPEYALTTRRVVAANGSRGGTNPREPRESVTPAGSYLGASRGATLPGARTTQVVVCPW